jgi:hypothetical protein
MGTGAHSSSSSAIAHRPEQPRTNAHSAGSCAPAIVAEPSCRVQVVTTANFGESASKRRWRPPFRYSEQWEVAYGIRNR